MNFKKIFFGFLSLATTSIRKRFNHSADFIINRIIPKMTFRKRPITLSKLTTGGVSFQNKKQTL